jgi:hypothetical protein
MLVLNDFDLLQRTPDKFYIVTLEFSFCEVYHNLSNVPKLKANMGIHTHSLVWPFRVGLNFTCSRQSSTGVEKSSRAKEHDTLISFSPI